MEQLPTKPLPSRECPLFCVFYAEFDIVVGPMVCFQSPLNFMDQDIEISTAEIEVCLEQTFRQLRPHDEQTPKSSGKTALTTSARVDDSEFLSIFDSTSEYIITGNELAGKMINLSTHNMHILTLPEIIFDERYERNNLLFCVGFVLRRAADPRPFRPLLSKLATVLRSTETESQCLTNPAKRPHLQTTLNNLLLSLNSGEANLLLDSANPLHLKLFHYPKPPPHPVPDHAVPILLRRDWQVQMYDWDLAVNWVVLHIDGINNAKCISVKSEVDLEMVRACLRVLKHHGAIALVDMFFYSNRYEATERAAAVLAGNEPKILQDAFLFCKRNKSLVDAALHHVPEHTDKAHLSSSLNNRSPPRSVALPSMSFPPLSIAGSNRSSHLGTLPERYLSTLSKEELRQVDFLAQWFVSFDQKVSFGDFLILKMKKSCLEISKGESQQSHFHHNESSGTESADSIKNEISKPQTDWCAAFSYFDHRRVAIFGVVHGLIRRVHNFPLAVETISAADSILESPIAIEQNDSTPKAGSVFMPRTMNPRKYNSTQGDENARMALRIVSRMNGKICDDEIVCHFDRSLEDLTDIVDTHRRHTILPIYSVG